MKLLRLLNRQCKANNIVVLGGSILFLTSMIFSACGTSDKSEPYHAKDLSKFETTTSLDTLTKQKYYVPVYSEIYSSNEHMSIQLTVTLSIRNTSTSDSVYIDKVAYYNSNGELIRNYLENTIALSPLQSVDFVVHEKDKSGGTGASFMVSGVFNEVTPVIQSVMIGTLNQQGISYLTNGVLVQ